MNIYGEKELDMVHGRIKEARSIRGLTQAGLAEMIKVSQKDVSRWESGEVVPSLISIRKLSMALEVSSDHLLGLKSELLHVKTSWIAEDIKEALESCESEEEKQKIMDVTAKNIL